MEEIHAPTARPLQRIAADRGRRGPLLACPLPALVRLAAVRGGRAPSGRRRGVWLGPARTRWRTPWTLSSFLLRVPGVVPSRGGARFSAGSRRSFLERSAGVAVGLPASPVDARRLGRRTVRRGASREVSFARVPSTFAGRAVRSGVASCPGRSRCGVRPAWAPTLRPVRPCGFRCACFAAGFIRRRRPGGSFVAGVSVRGSRTGPARRTILATWPHGFEVVRRRPWDSLSRPSQCASDRG